MSIWEFLANLFSFSNPLWYYYPLCLVIGAVYKMTKFDRPGDIIYATLHFFISVSLGMLALSVALYLIVEYL